MAKLFITPLGSSCRKKFCDELQNMEYGVGAIVLPNRLLLDEVRKNYANVETVGMDTLASKLLNLNGYVTFNQINRHSQELIIEDFLHTYHGARKAGFDNISVDLMSALPGQNKEMLQNTLEQVIALQPEHIYRGIIVEMNQVV